MNYKVPTHPFPETKLFVNALNHNLSRTLVKGASENGRKNTAKSNPYWRILPAADYGHKNNTLSECATTESYNIHERLLKKWYNNKEVIHPGNCPYQIFSFTFQLPHKKRSYYISPFLSA